MSPGAMMKERGGVGLGKALYVSRVGKVPQQKWNGKANAANTNGESDLLRELRKALAENEESAVPATPCRPQQAAAADGEVAVADAGVDAGEACGEAAAAAEMMCE
eukprot:4294884-Prymnesium_polylepis.1